MRRIVIVGAAFGAGPPQTAPNTPADSVPTVTTSRLPRGIRTAWLLSGIRRTPARFFTRAAPTVTGVELPLIDTVARRPAHRC